MYTHIRSMRRHAAKFVVTFSWLLFIGFFQSVRAEALTIPTQSQMDEALSDSVKNLFNNLNQPGLSSGVVIASPSQQAPDYYYHWTRDAALTHESLYRLYEATQDANLKNQIVTMAKEWIAFETQTQANSVGSVAGLGEPRYYVNGQVNASNWGRPQSDGPAARAITMTLWALKFMDQGDNAYVGNNLYRAELPATSPIKKDLEYVLDNWKKTSFDLWEETRALHFFNLAMQRRALILGATLAGRMQDAGAAVTYLNEAEKIKAEMQRFMESGKPYIAVSLDNDGGWTSKTSGVDIAVILAANHALKEDDFFLSQKFMFQKTQAVLEEKFYNLYDINKIDPTAAMAIGRYPEDVYDGVSFSGANPWFIATHASAEFYCNLGKLETYKPAAEALKKQGLAFLNTSLKHREQTTGEMTEQFSRANGYLVGARHLTWSYASYITAYLACQ